MKNRVIIIFSLMLLISVLMAVTLIESIQKTFPQIEPFLPMIFITGFFTFLVAVGLFVYGFVGVFRNE